MQYLIQRSPHKRTLQNTLIALYITSSYTEQYCFGMPRMDQFTTFRSRRDFLSVLRLSVQERCMPVSQLIRETSAVNERCFN
jgi:hypothetical protein